jgi:hypothetical protein
MVWKFARKHDLSQFSDAVLSALPDMEKIVIKAKVATNQNSPPEVSQSARRRQHRHCNHHSKGGHHDR